MRMQKKKNISNFRKDGPLGAGYIAVAKWSNMLANVVIHTRDIVIDCGYRVFVVLRCSSSLGGGGASFKPILLTNHNGFPCYFVHFTHIDSQLLHIQICSWEVNRSIKL